MSSALFSCHSTVDGNWNALEEKTGLLVELETSVRCLAPPGMIPSLRATVQKKLRVSWSSRLSRETWSTSCTLWTSGEPGLSSPLAMAQRQLALCVHHDRAHGE